MELEDIYNIIQKRRKEIPNNSYVASLFKNGSDKIIQKVGEEAAEVIIAAKNEDKREIISEVADLLFHTLVLLIANNITLEEVLRELRVRRNKKNLVRVV